MTKAKNAARRWLAVADVTPTARRVGRFMADHARFATAADVRRKVKPGEIFCYWSLAKVAVELGVSEGQINRGVRSLREAGVIQVRRLPRPSAASKVFMKPALSFEHFWAKTRAGASEQVGGDGKRIVLSHEDAWRRTRAGAMGVGLPMAPEDA